MSNDIEFPIRDFIRQALFAIITFFLIQLAFIRWIRKDDLTNFGLIIVFMSLIKTMFFVLYYFERIVYAEALKLGKGLLVLVFYIILTIVIVSFAFDYWALYFIDSSFFNGIRNESLIVEFIDFLYYSATTFATVGYGDIHGKSSSAKIISMLEMLTSITILAVLLANHNTFRKSNSTGK